MHFYQDLEVDHPVDEVRKLRNVIYQLNKPGEV